jgi:Protein of unknown function (DUF5672)
MQDARSSVAVVVPFPRPELTDSERISLRHLTHFLASYDRFLVMPRSLRSGLAGFGVKRVPDKYLESRRGYSALLLSRDFYERFSDYEYILIYQLDCLVFSGELSEWCAKGYDYIGAVHTIGDNPPCAGQGGFSLRRVQGCLGVLSSPLRTVDPAEYWERHWASRPLLERGLNLPRRWAKHFRRLNGVQREIRRRIRSYHEWAEDWFWSLEAAKYKPDFRLAPVEEGLRFAFDEDPDRAFEAAGQQLPFGCHGWPRRSDFWERFVLPPQA